MEDSDFVLAQIMNVLFRQLKSLPHLGRVKELKFCSSCSDEEVSFKTSILYRTNSDGNTMFNFEFLSQIFVEPDVFR